MIVNKCVTNNVQDQDTTNQDRQSKATVDIEKV